MSEKNKVNDTIICCTKDILNFERVKEVLLFKLINPEKNKGFLETIPHRKFLDLEVVYYIPCFADRYGECDISVNNMLKAVWDVSEETLYQVASENYKELRSSKIYLIEDLLREMVPEMEFEYQIGDYPVYVLTNSNVELGAASMLYPENLDLLSDIMKTDFYLIPSSVHEWIIVPAILKKEELDEFIKKVNLERVHPVDVLGNHCYLYLRNDKKIVW